MLNETGNQDLCYYNFLCSHSFVLGPWKFSDFNHIFSNIGYIFFGLLFILITYKRECVNMPNQVSDYSIIVTNYNLLIFLIKYFKLTTEIWYSQSLWFVLCNGISTGYGRVNECLLSCMP